MYIAERRQSNSTRLVGLIGAAAVMASVGAVLVSIRQTIVTPILPPPIFIAPQIDDPPIIDPIDLSPPDKVDPIPLTPLAIPTMTFEWDKPDTTAPSIPTGDKPGNLVTALPSSTPTVVGPPTTRPVFIPGGEKPTYPPAAARAHESGTTTLSLCISKQGKVTDASISGSSGSSRLDQAALAWIRHERFKPGTENGKPADMCNHTLAYVWELPKP